MQAIPTRLKDVFVIAPRVFGDSRGFFFESFNQQAFETCIGAKPGVIHFVQDNHSRSVRGVLRGLHFQRSPKAQGKLVRVVEGLVFDVAVDLRPSSPDYGKWHGEMLSAENKRQMWIPPGFAHGFVVLSESAEFLYKTTDYYSPAHEVCLCWDDPAVGVVWPLDGLTPILSDKDKQGLALADLPRD